MKKKIYTDDLELYLDPKPLTKGEKLKLSLFIRQLKEKAKHSARVSKSKTNSSIIGSKARRA